MATDMAGAQANETPQDAWVRWQREHAEVMTGAAIAALDL